MDEDIQRLHWSVYICITLVLLATLIDAQHDLYRWMHPVRVHKVYQPPVDQTKWDYSWKSSIVEIKE
jgi:hypothetical protein